MTPTEAAAMTTDQLRDWCAVDDGWQRLERDNDIFEHTRTGEIHASDGQVADHPYPPTRDGAAAALPEGWVWDRYRVQWSAFKKVNGLLRIVRTPDTRDEIADRYRLAVACRIAEKERP